jgi:hypothetical protein
MSCLSLCLACQHVRSGTDLSDCEDQSWFKVLAVHVFRFDWCKMFSHTPGGTLSVENVVASASHNPMDLHSLLQVFGVIETHILNTYIRLFWDLPCRHTKKS